MQQKALASALFLKGMSRFVRPERLLDFSQQTTSLLSALLEGALVASDAAAMMVS